jgi:hypothetical protein
MLMGGCCTKQTETYVSAASIIKEIEHLLSVGRPYLALKLYRKAGLDDYELGVRIEEAMDLQAKNSRRLTE